MFIIVFFFMFVRTLVILVRWGGRADTYLCETNFLPPSYVLIVRVLIVCVESAQQQQQCMCFRSFY